MTRLVDSMKKHRVIWFVILATSIFFSLELISETRITTGLVDLFKLIFSKNELFFSLSLLVGIGGGTLTLMTQYLNKGIGDRNKSEPTKNLTDDVDSLKKQVATLTLSSNYHGFDALDENEKKSLIDFAKKRIVGNTLTIADVSLRDEIELFKKKININKIHSDMVFRIENEIDRLNRRGGANLAIGFTIALLGISVLGYFLFIPQGQWEKMDYFLHLLPKLSFVLFVEIFAFFFLKLYKNGFDEIKYFQNEITNLESRMIAVNYSLNTGNSDVEKEVILSLMKTERNFVLEKGQSTVFLEKERMLQEKDKQITAAMAEILKLKMR